MTFSVSLTHMTLPISTRTKGLFTRTISVSMSVSVTVKVYHCVNRNGPFDGQNGFCTHSAHQTDRHHRHNVIL